MTKKIDVSQINIVWKYIRKKIQIRNDEKPINDIDMKDDDKPINIADGAEVEY